MTTLELAPTEAAAASAETSASAPRESPVPTANRMNGTVG